MKSQNSQRSNQEKNMHKQRWSLFYCKLKREFYRILGKSKKVAKYNEKIQEIKQAAIKPRTEIRHFGILCTKHTLYVAHGIERALKKTGRTCTIITDASKEDYPLDIYFVIFPQAFKKIPSGEKRIIVQLEQSISSRWFTADYVDIIKKSLAVFDYSEKNLFNLENHQINYPHTFYLPIEGLSNYDPYNQKINASIKEYDVIFYGDPNNERRKSILDAVKKKYKTKIISEVFGENLHRELMKGRLVLNIHYYEGALLETTRIYECLSLGIPVVSESSIDIDEHPSLHEIVKFAEIGNTEDILQKIEDELQESIQDYSAHIKESEERFNFMFHRALLAMKFIDFEQFSDATKESTIKADEFCLSLPETVARRTAFREATTTKIDFFDGIRYTPGWIGCALSYKYLCRKTIEAKNSRLFICEDDVLLGEHHAQRTSAIENYLTSKGENWDIFCGLIAHLNPDVEIIETEDFEGETFVTINMMTSMVYNIYNNRAIKLISEWDENNKDVDGNTIDRYLEKNKDLKIITTLPFLVGHREEVNSSLWGFNNEKYSEMIKDSEILLKKKIDEYKKNNEFNLQDQLTTKGSLH